MERRGRKNRRRSTDAIYEGPERKSGVDRRSGKDTETFSDISFARQIDRFGICYRDNCKIKISEPRVLV
ncbi:MAG TPA: hypothetical protein VEI57_19220 [Nitrospirota bacterium]|nr:hypothetical protein [Nitrospirota bacterium]